VGVRGKGGGSRGRLGRLLGGESMRIESAAPSAPLVFSGLTLSFADPPLRFKAGSNGAGIGVGTVETVLMGLLYSVYPEANRVPGYGRPGR
jgi:hypothetical protein